MGLDRVCDVWWLVIIVNGRGKLSVGCLVAFWAQKSTSLMPVGSNPDSNKDQQQTRHWVVDSQPTDLLIAFQTDTMTHGNDWAYHQVHFCGNLIIMEQLKLVLLLILIQIKCLVCCWSLTGSGSEPTEIKDVDFLNPESKQTADW